MRTSIENALRFNELIEEASKTRKGMDARGLLDRLDELGFYQAPASTQYHCSYLGGLVDHVMNVYDALVKLVNEFGDGYCLSEEFPTERYFNFVCQYQSALYDEVNETSYDKVLAKCMNVVQMTDKQLEEEMISMFGIVTEEQMHCYRKACERFVGNLPTPDVHRYRPETLIIVALLHCVSKATLYERSVRNKKVYSEHGSKSDELGRFDWVAEEAYVVSDVNGRDVIGSTGFSSYYEISEFVPLTKEETVAIVNQRTYSRFAADDLPDVMTKYNLTALLYAADIIATYCLDKRHE